ncbi:Cytochrome P450 [Quillaja saponaria]|uniref:Cytochrome P450 n=1 Tax=Quillaja saponaria TaxID=32244 RepID=A0AAD7PVW7_QUISA|nr:Cytochrome P450 [Quillaja saponaria]
MISTLTTNIIFRAIVGSQCKDRDEFISLVKEVFVLGGGFDLPDLFPSLKFLSFVTGMKPALESIHNKMDKILESVINENRMKRKNSVNHQEDLMDVLLNLQESGELDFDITDDQIKTITRDMFGGGIETTTTTLEWAMSELTKNPRVMEKAQGEVRQVLEGKSKTSEANMQEPVYLKSIINETLRLHPPGALHLRQARERCEINGYKIPTGTKIFINAWAIGRDSKHWVDADKFWPERFQGSSIDFRGTDFEFIPFGAGRRMCPSISFAYSIVIPF